MKIDPESYPSIASVLAKAEPETKVIKNFRHKGQYYSIIEKDPGALKKKLYVFMIDGETFSNNGKGWASAEQTMQAIKQYVREPHREAVASGDEMEFPAVDKALGEDLGESEIEKEGETNALDKTEGAKQFEVHVAHDASIYCDVLLNADDAEDAEEKAFEMARNGELNWALSDGNGTDDPYLPNDESVEEIGADEEE